MFGSMGHKVIRLIRISLGSLVLGSIPVGGSRELTPKEVEDLRSYYSYNSQHAEQADITQQIAT